MKKVILLLMALVMMGNMSFAQDKKAPKSATAVQKVNKNEASAKAMRTKKDGSPDMRYKANKEAAVAEKPAGPLKKDGTPDKRFKANKSTDKK